MTKLTTVKSDTQAGVIEAALMRAHKIKPKE